MIRSYLDMDFELGCTRDVSDNYTRVDGGIYESI
jgi:hypothetical protein